VQLTLGPEARLRRSADIARCRNNGSKLYSKHFLVIAAPGASAASRIAVAVTTKIEKRATVRNLIKRRIKDLFRKHRHELTEVLDLLIVARRDVQQCGFDDYQREILGALRSRGYLPKRSSSSKDAKHAP
jgi:ribonuclease P protein component